MDSRQEDIIQQALDYPENLTTWEYDFINSMAEQEYPATERQNETLEKIASKLGI